MKILIEDIPEDGLDLEVREQGSVIKRHGRFDFDIDGEVSASLSLTRAGVLVIVEGDLSATVLPKCSRCLKEFRSVVDKHLRESIVLGEPPAGETELTSEDIEIEYLSGDEIDTLDVLTEQIALEAKVKPLCSPQCKGLCPKCGADLNQGDCNCKPVEAGQDIDPRLKKLGDFKSKKN